MNFLKLSALALVCALVGYAQSDDEWEKLVKKPSFSLSEAIDKGLKEGGKGTVFHAELEFDKGSLVYSIDIAQGKKMVGVVLDVKEGNVVEKEEEEEDHSEMVKACKVSLKTAIDTASKKIKGTPIEAQMMMKSGKPVIFVKVFDGKIKTFLVNGISGDELDDTSESDKKFTDRFNVDDDELASKGSNPYFILEPGYTLVLESKNGKETEQIKITVLDETKKVHGIETRIVEERETVNGELSEISRNYFAISKKTNDIYYFGEDVDIYKDGKVVGHDGAWLSGVKKARFGLMMPGTVLLGSRFYNEIAPDVALDRVEIISMSETIETPAGKFENVLKIEETTPLTKEKSYKYYALGVGLIKDDSAKLIKVKK